VPGHYAEIAKSLQLSGNAVKKDLLKAPGVIQGTEPSVTYIITVFDIQRNLKS